MIAFHQNHIGSFSSGKLNKSKQQELQEGEAKLLEVLGNIQAVNEFKENTKQVPIRPRYDSEKYKPKVSNLDLLKLWIKNNYFFGIKS